MLVIGGDNMFWFEKRLQLTAENMDMHEDAEAAGYFPKRKAVTTTATLKYLHSLSWVGIY